jgi:hypothetical protein
MNIFSHVKQSFYTDFTLASLKTIIILWAIGVIILVSLINNKWILAAIAAYEMLP